MTGAEARSRARRHARLGYFDTAISREKEMHRLLDAKDLAAAERLEPAKIWMTCPESGCRVRPHAYYVRGRPDHDGLLQALTEHLAVDHV